MTDADQDELLRLCVELTLYELPGVLGMSMGAVVKADGGVEKILAKCKADFAKRKGAENDDPSDSRRDDRDGIRGDRSPDGDGAVVLRVSEGEMAYHRASERTCVKRPHDARGGFLHREDDDRPYDVDGSTYCGRCHHAIDAKGECSPRHAAPAQGEHGADASTPQQASGDGGGPPPGDPAVMCAADLDAVTERSRRADVPIVPAALMRRMVSEIRRLWSDIAAARAAGLREGKRLGLEHAAVIAENEWRHASNTRPEYRQNAISHGCLASAAAIRAAIAELAAEPDVAASGEG